jgi:long-chain acyl-CoA synthetase
LPFTPAHAQPDDVAVLQYTAVPRGSARGQCCCIAIWSPISLQSEAWYGPALRKVPAGIQFSVVCALPIYHVFGFNVCVMLSMHIGARNILVANPRDMKALFKDLAGQTFHSFPAVNTLFNAMASHPDFASVNWRNLVLSVGGGGRRAKRHGQAVA